MALELNNLSAPVRHCLYTVLILASAAVWHVVCQQPRNEYLAAVNGDNERLTAQLRHSAGLRARHDQCQSDLAELSARLTSLQSVIPTEKEASAFLRTVQDMAASSDLRINLFRPGSPVSRDFYFEWPVEVRLEGNYHGLGRFFEKIGRATRVVSVPTVIIGNIGSQTDHRWTLIANGTITTYIQGELSGEYATEE